MAYPPTIPPATRTNTTPQADNHPADHNGMSQALSSIINELGSNPSGPQGTVQARVTALEGDAVKKSPTSLQTMTGSLQAAQMYVTSPPNGVNALTNKAYTDATYVNVNGDTLTGQVNGTWFIGSSGVQAGGNAEINEPGVRLLPDGRMFSVGGNPMSPAANLRLSKKAGTTADNVGEDYIRFAREAGAPEVIGQIRMASTTSVAYQTSSDYRAKEAVGPVTDAAARIKALAPLGFRGRWIADGGSGQEWDMFNAHDVDAAAPYAISGTKDAVDAEGVPIWQSVDYSALVPLLVMALGEALTRIEQLEAG